MIIQGGVALAHHAEAARAMGTDRVDLVSFSRSDISGASRPTSTACSSTDRRRVSEADVITPSRTWQWDHRRDAVEWAKS